MLSLEENSPKRDELKKNLQKDLDLDDLNMAYFLILYNKFKNPNDDSLNLVIHQERRSIDSSREVEVFPTAIAPNELMEELPVAHYKDLVAVSNKSGAKKAVVWIKKMQAGTGTSMNRTAYLAKLHNKAPSDIKMGAKGTDLEVKTPKGEFISLAEMQFLQAIYDVHHGYYSGVFLHDIVSSETKDSIEEIWNKKALVDKSQTYEQLVNNTKGLGRSGESFQYFIPTLDDNKRISFNRKAPGGHALFGVDAVRAAYIDELRPQVKEGEVLVSSIGNGEDLSSSPDEAMVNWMAQNDIPVAMVTTTKTNNDLKGGQISIVKPRSGKPYVSMVEKAQAEESKQIELFELLGLREGDNEAFFNTNMVLINYNVFSKKIKTLLDEVGENKLLQIISPDLILNGKKQIDADGVERTYTQLEGAMGSVFLNLDKFWRQKYGECLVHILNVDAHNRTKFFSPLKTSFDFFMQFYSDRFRCNFDNYRLENKAPGKLPKVNLKNSFYKEVQHTLDCFSNCSILDLDVLDMTGKWQLTKVSLQGNISLKSESDMIINLNQLFSSMDSEVVKNLKIKDEWSLRDATICIDKDGKINKFQIAGQTLI
ncbi:MAG: UTP--glucose-1-phosphate uridylyltransferase [Bacteriovoracia bacterium]